MKTYKRALLLFILLIKFLFLSANFNLKTTFATSELKQEEQDCEISELDINIDVIENNTYYITEAYDMNYYSSEELLREIPLIFDGIKRNVLNIDISGLPEDKIKYNIIESEDSLLIYFKNEDSSNNAKFILSYTYIMGNDMDKSKDFFYYDLIGNEIDTTIDNVNININMPKDFKDESIKLNSSNQRISEIFDYYIKDNNLNIKSSNYMKKNNSLSVSFDLDEGYFNTEKGVFYNIPYLACIIALIFMFIVLILTIKNKVGYKLLINSMYNKNSEEKFVSMYSPLEVSCIYSSKGSIRDVINYLYYWDDMNYITLIKEHNDYKVIFKDFFINAPKYEQSLFDYLLDKSTEKILYISEITPEFKDIAKETIKEAKRDITFNKRIYDVTYKYKGIIYRHMSLLLFSFILGVSTYKILGKPIYIVQVMAIVYLSVHGLISVIEGLFNKSVKYNLFQRVFLIFELITPYILMLNMIKSMTICKIYSTYKYKITILSFIIALVILLFTLLLSYLGVPLSKKGMKINSQLKEEKINLTKIQREYIGNEIAYAKALDVDSTYMINRDILRCEFRDFSDEKI